MLSYLLKKKLRLNNLDQGAKLMADLDVSSIILNAYTNLITTSTIDSSGDSGENITRMTRILTECVKAVDTTFYVGSFNPSGTPLLYQNSPINLSANPTNYSPISNDLSADISPDLPTDNKKKRQSKGLFGLFICSGNNRVPRPKKGQVLPKK